MALFGKRKNSSGDKPSAPAPSSAAPGLKSVSGLTNLHDVAARGTVEDVHTLLAAGADVNEPNRVGYTPLSLAASRGDVEVARALLDGGAEVDSADPTGTTPLAVAVLASKGRGDMILLLLERGADPARPNRRGQTPLELAQRMKTHDLTQYFAARS